MKFNTSPGMILTMDVLLLILYFGLSFILFDLVKILLGKERALFLPRIIVLSLLLTLHILFIFFVPPGNRYPVLVLILVSITSLATLAADYFKNLFYKNFIPNMLRENNFALFVYLFNLDYHSKALLKLKQILPLLQQNKQKGLEELITINEKSALKAYIPWNRDVLAALRFLGHTESAISFYDKLDIDLSKPGIPLDFISLIVNILIKKKRFSDTTPYFHYIQKHYTGIQHIQLVLYMYLSFYAHTGSREQFAILLEKNPVLKKDPLLPYWQAILLLKSGHSEQGTVLLTHFKNNLPPHLQNFLPQIEQILNNPARYSEYPEEGRSFAASIPPPQSHSALIPGTRLKTRKTPGGTVIICAIVLLATLLQFALSLVGTRLDFIGFKDVVPLDYISLGAYSDFFVNEGEWGRLFTAIFLHAGWLHLLLNVYGLFITGKFVEKAYGTLPMISIFILSGVAGNIASHMISPYPLSVGASGGVFGLLASIFIFVVWRRKFLAKGNLESFLINFAVIMGINIIFGLQNPRINNIAHLGGFTGGIVLSYLFIRLLNKPETKRILHIVSQTAIILCAAVLLLFWPHFYTQNYFDNLTLTKEINISGYSVRAPEFWKKDSREAEINSIVDFLTGNKILIFKDHESEYNSDIKQEIEKEILYYISPDNYGKDYELGKPLIELNNGWYSFSFKKKSEKDELYDFITFYTKVLHSSVCRVICFSLKKYTSGFNNLVYRVLDNIKE